MVVGNRRSLREWKVVKNQVHGYLALVKFLKLPTSKTLWLSTLEDVGLQLFPPSQIFSNSNQPIGRALRWVHSPEGLEIWHLRRYRQENLPRPCWLQGSLWTRCQHLGRVEGGLHQSWWLQWEVGGVCFFPISILNCDQWTEKLKGNGI